MAKVADSVELIVRPNGSADLFVDGVEFPWEVSWESVSVGADESELVRVSLTLLAKRATTSLEQVPVNEPAEPPLDFSFVGETEEPDKRSFPRKVWDVVRDLFNG